MDLYLGIDGGGTHTRGWLSDPQGHVLARAEGGLSNPNHSTDAELESHIRGLLEALFPTAVAVPGDVVSVFAGIAGITCASTAERFRGIIRRCGLEIATIGIDHDIRIALAGGLGGSPGIALIVGTGSACYGRDASGRAWQTGGWGALLGDEGSGYDLGLKAIITAVRMADGRQEPTSLKDVVFSWLGISDTSEVLRRVYEDGLTRPEIAAFAPRVVELATHGDQPALAMLDQGADELASMVEASHRQLPTGPGPDVVMLGGLATAATPYRPKIETAILRRLPSARIALPVLEPVGGAVMLAIEQGAGELSPAVIENLRRTNTA